MVNIKDDMVVYSDRIYMNNGTSFCDVKGAVERSGVRFNTFADGTCSVYGTKEQLYTFIMECACDGCTQIIIV